jgi:hypothetical protein
MALRHFLAEGNNDGASRASCGGSISTQWPFCGQIPTHRGGSQCSVPGSLLLQTRSRYNLVKRERGGGFAGRARATHTSKRGSVLLVSPQKRLRGAGNVPAACHGQDGLSRPGDPDVLVEVPAAQGGKRGGAHGRGGLCRERGSRARTAEGQGHCCGVQWLSAWRSARWTST